MKAQKFSLKLAKYLKFAIIILFCNSYAQLKIEHLSCNWTCKQCILIEEASNSPVSLLQQWKELYGDKPLPEDKGEFLEFLLDEAWLLQEEICEKADTIKINGASEAEKHYAMIKEAFINSVDITVANEIQKEKLKKDSKARATAVQTKIDKTKKISNALHQSVSIF